MNHRPTQTKFSAFFLLAMSASLSALAQASSTGTNAAPYLAPPYGEIAPTFWELHATAVIVSAIVLVLVVALAIVLALQPRKIAPPAPALVARKELAKLANRPEDGACLSAVSQVLRRYFIAAFRLADGELNTSEFCAAIAGKPEIGPDLSIPVTNFLRQCDERKFSPKPGPTPLGAVTQAEDFLARGEARRAAIQPPTA